MEPQQTAAKVSATVLQSLQTPAISSTQSMKASLLARYAAFVIDSIFTYIIFLIIFFFVSFAGYKVLDIFLGLGPLITYSYYVFFTGYWGATPGKKVFDISVIDAASGQKPTWGRVLLREVLGKILSSFVFSLGYLWALWDKDKQGWHDKIANTYVVQKTPLAGGKKFLAYFFALGVPVVIMIAVLAVIIILAINPQAQIERAKQTQQLQNQQIQDNYPTQAE